MEHSVTKTSDADEVQAGDTFKYTITAENKGTEAWELGDVVDTLPTGLTYVSDDAGVPVSVNTEKTVVTMSFGTLSGNTTKVVVITVQVDEDVALGTEFENSITVNGNEVVDPNPPIVAYSLTKESSVTEVAPGESYTYTITATNDGEEDWVLGDVTDVLASELSLTGTGGDATVTSVGNTLTIAFGTIAPNTSKTVTLTVQVAEDAEAGTILYNTLVMSDGKEITDPNPPEVVEHSVTKTSDATTVQVGDQYVYEITATNKGDVDWENVVAEDILVDALTYVSADGDATVTSDGQVLSIDFGTIAAGESKTVYITVLVNDNAVVGETIENTVTIGDNKGTDPDGPEIEEKAAETHTVYYNANGGTGEYSVSVTTGDIYTVLTPASVGITRSGYTFTRWNTSADGSGTSYTSGSTITIADADITLYAQWNSSSGGGGGGSTTYKVKYDGNGNTGGSVPTDSKSYSSGATVTVLDNTGELVKTSYTFAGWNTAADGSGTTYKAGGTFKITSTTTLYAVWTTGSSGSGGGSSTINDSDVPLASLTTDHIWYIQGYPQNKVGPDNNLTRAEAAAIFYRLVDDSSKDQKSFTNSFSDVSESNWYYHEVSYLANYKIILGYEDGTFRGDAFISRAEFAAIASRFDTLTLTEDNAFEDVSSSHWAVRYINSAAAKGWITGYSDGTFRPDQNITRAETVALVNRELNRALTAANEPDDLHVYADLDSSHWAYYDIMEASHTHDYDLDSNQDEVWTSYSYAKD